MKALLPALLLLLPGDLQEDPPRKPVSAPGFLANFQHALGQPFPGPWQAYVLDLDNSLGRDVEVRIRVEEELSRTAVTRTETVPHQSKRRVFFYLPSGIAGAYAGAMQPKFKVAESSGRALASGMLPPAGRGWGEAPFVVGLVSGGEAASDRVFGFPSQSGGRQVEVGRFTPSTFPDRWIGLSALDTLILHDPPFDQFTPDQGRALLDWVRMGGVAILSPGKNRGVYTHDLVKSLATIRVGEPEVTSALPRLNALYGGFGGTGGRDFVFHRIENGREKFFPEAHREVLDFPVGFGTLVALRFNVRERPFESWRGLEGFWGGILDRVPRRHQKEGEPLAPASGLAERQQMFQAMARFVNPYPSFMLLIGVTVLFIAAVGPANYLLLRRLRMTLLVVVSVPAISLAFLGLILGLGYVLKGTSTVVHSVRILHGREGVDVARETHLFSVFSPSTRTYDVAFGSGTYGLPGDRLGVDEERSFNPFHGREGEPLECSQDAAGLVFRGLGVGQWRSRHVEARALVDLGGAVTFEGDGTVLRVANGTKRRIVRGIHLKVGRGGSAIPFGELPPGGSIEVQPVPAPYDPLRDLGYAPDSLAARLLQEHFLRLPHLYRSERLNRQKEFLICVLEGEDPPPVTVDARLSSASRSLTLLHLAEDRP